MSSFRYFIPPRVPVAENLIVPLSLPIASKRDEIATAITNNQVTIICGETGSGKSTQIPKICLSIGRGRGMGGAGLIGQTQPRRLAACTIAKKIAEELQDENGDIVGYKIRFHDNVKRSASVKIMTDGILLAEIQSDKLLTQYDTLIIDEAHERSLNVDFLLGYLSEILLQRSDLKLVIMSATINAQRFADFFSGHKFRDTKKESKNSALTKIRFVPIIEISGRTYPIDILYRPIELPVSDNFFSGHDEIVGDVDLDERRKSTSPLSKTVQKENEFYHTLSRAIEELINFGPGDILIFLSGEREIKEVKEYLTSFSSSSTEILPLFATLSNVNQKKIFVIDKLNSKEKRRIILATNIAETSLTVPGIRYVIDVGYAKLKRYSYRRKIEQLCLEKISQASAQQRTGRCGRTGYGICIRLYSESDFNNRPAFTDPEILRSSLASIILKMKALAIGEISSFPFLDKPKSRALNDGLQQLFELGALSSNGNVTEVGMQLVSLPVDPRIGRMILAAAREENCLNEVLIVASALSIQDPRERPMDNSFQAKAIQKMFIHQKTDFFTYLNLWEWCQSKKQELASKRLWTLAFCQHYLSVKRISEWEELHSQLKIIVKNRHWQLNTLAATYEQCHRAFLTGLLSHVGLRSADGLYYLGKQNIKISLLPDSIFSKKKPLWVMSAELCQTNRLYAKTLARIDPKWLEELASHLIKRTSINPHWDAKTGSVMAFEYGELYGLSLYRGRVKHFGKKPQERGEARKIFIFDGLILNDPLINLPFILKNKFFLEICEKLRHRFRRSIFSLDKAALFSFYDERLPDWIIDVSTLERWYIEGENKRLLCFDQFFISPWLNDKNDLIEKLFPNYLTILGTKMYLNYYFNLNADEDGVTLKVPLFLVNRLESKMFEWLVPGMLADKVRALIKSLSTHHRRFFLPLASYVESFVERFSLSTNCAKESLNTMGLFDVLIKDAKQHFCLSLTKKDFDLDRIEPHYFMNFHILDEKNNVIAFGRDLAELQNKLEEKHASSFHFTMANAIGRGQVNSYVPLNVNMKLKMEESPSTKCHEKNIKKEYASKIIEEVDDSAKVEELNVHEMQICLYKMEKESLVPVILALNKRFAIWEFGDLPEAVILKGSLGEIIAYPALHVDGEAVCIKIMSASDEAETSHYLGCRQLFFTQLKHHISNLQKKIQKWKKPFLIYLSLFGSSQELLGKILLRRVIERLFLQLPLPRTQQDFFSRLNALSDRVLVSMENLLIEIEPIFIEYERVREKLKSNGLSKTIYQDVQNQISNLLYSDFLDFTPDDVLPHLTRYLKAIDYRIGKFFTFPQSEARLFNDLEPILKIQNSLLSKKNITSSPDYYKFRWAVEELRVSLFAQNFGTAFPISVKRVLKLAEKLL